MKKSLILFLIVAAVGTAGCKKSKGHDKYTRECTYNGETVDMAKIKAYQTENETWHFLTEASFSELNVKLHFGDGNDFCQLSDKEGNSLDSEINGTNYQINHYYWNDVVSIQFEVTLDNGKKIEGDYFDKYTVVQE